MYVKKKIRFRFEKNGLSCLETVAQQIDEYRVAAHIISRNIAENYKYKGFDMDSLTYDTDIA